MYKNIFYIVLIAVISSSTTFLLMKKYNSSNKGPVINKIISPQNIVKPTNKVKQLQTIASLPDNEDGFISAAENTMTSVVNIESKQEESYGFFGQTTLVSSSGSGVIITSDGYIVTNHHVIKDAVSLTITLENRHEYDAKVVGYDKSTDLALLKIESDSLDFISFGDSDHARIGEWVLAVGNPFNLNSTVTAGIISAKGRNIDIINERASIESFIQTDAVVNPGNSGGALVNVSGDLIGINTAIITQTGSYEGYSFAIPSNLVAKVVNDLKEFGVVQRGFLGVSIQDIDAQAVEELDLDDTEGVLITDISENGGADDAGLSPGDVIIEVNGTATDNIPQLQEQVAKFTPGDKVIIKYIRNGASFETEIILKNKMNTTDTVLKLDKEILTNLGIISRDIRQEEYNGYRTNAGVLVVSIKGGSKIAETNMEPGFVITKVNNKYIKDQDHLIEMIDAAKGEIILEGVYYKYKGEYYYTFNK